MDSQRRIWLIAAGAAGCVGGAGAALPFAESLGPSAKARAEGGPIEVDISALRPAEKMTVLWRGQPIWFLRRTPQMLASLEHTDALVADPLSKNQDVPTPVWAQNRWRSIRPEYLVVVGICTHLGCSPVDRFRPGPQPSLPADWDGGFLCPCHGSEFDLAARVFKNMPAPANLPVPPYRFIGEHKILLGEAQA
ncbi:MAG: ubiquinol-cytochrome c reductase iron-sulfur subunit [Betaproteobacteria bacterium]|jgi:ubiquinol-cytochrome c reductase iron-sulfur subunit|uniref:ubiquinol-cytochrome c reductase iron-sulfur subunit n=1 Tax=Thiomonas sp. FB-6 TaxID=1158291 RepID=UPI0003763671|nr:ubiquinol-cytochrome c reductase iron-sulfur subunit [Thiomonas sp. FB-6]MBU6439281.1 ubiquinol-cytochrome c reductase iron-sulfur subunit [Betaproteobacteria bacterium]MBU6512256.1 ubiquinol-cytochrome c reductase iron-sulfur subunit [Betaproteobacteria bacterium]MDE1955800.1 ubiquinol-cytochrome c reductase iron-sulfur subunit [Betaproteobacteria bacterium]MDE2152456.1 ubiquinol-cytochrome c reductase iron-sulfur subunit [Betaproteobacteria bacterium]MDE2477521.1 ubiquinol-cytochrome c re